MSPPSTVSTASDMKEVVFMPTFPEASTVILTSEPSKRAKLLSPTPAAVSLPNVHVFAPTNLMALLAPELASTVK